MDKDVRRYKKINLALAIAEGESVSAWAQQNGGPKRTAFRWAQDPKVRGEVEACRRWVANQPIGRLTGMITKAADGIVTLAQESESESVQLRAWRAILADQMAAFRFADLEHRMVGIEELLRDRTGHTDHAG